MLKMINDLSISIDDNLEYKLKYKLNDKLRNNLYSLYLKSMTRYVILNGSNDVLKWVFNYEVIPSINLRWIII